MNIGIIVFSNTGNTLSVAQKLKESLTSKGHIASLARVEQVSDSSRTAGPVKLKSAPTVNEYDAIIFASPVQAFSLAPVMRLYLSQISSLADKVVCCFVTQHLTKPWLGGSKAIRQIKAACRKNGADVRLSGIVNWSSSSRNQQIDDIVSRLSAI